MTPLLLRRLSPASLTSGDDLRTCHDTDMDLAGWQKGEELVLILLC